MFPVKRIPTLISENTMRYLKTTYLENGQRSGEQNIYIPYVFRNSSLNEVKPEFSETYKTPQKRFCEEAVRFRIDLGLLETIFNWKPHMMKRAILLPRICPRATMNSLHETVKQKRKCLAITVPQGLNLGLSIESRVKMGAQDEKWNDKHGPVSNAFCF